MLPSPRAIAFDLDGTLVDSLADLTASANHVRAARGLAPEPIEVVRTYIGNGASKLVQRTLSLADDETDAIDLALREFRAHYREHCLDRTRPYPGVRETLAALSPMPMAVVSNKPQSFTELVVEGLGLAEFFGSVVGARSGVPVKPAPDLIRLAFAELEVDPTRGWMVGDSFTDVGGGRAVGCSVVAVTYGLGDLFQFEGHTPDIVIDSFAELLTLLS